LAIQDLFSAVFETIFSIVSVLAQGIWSVIQSAADSIWNTITSVWNNIVAFIAPILQSIWDTVSNIWNAIWSTITSICSAIWSTISAIWNSIWSTISSILSAIVEAVASKVSEIYNRISSKFSEILGYLGGLPSQMAAKGRDIIQGLINGIASKIGAVSAKIREIGSVVTNGIKKVFDIHSPSRVMRKLGAFTFGGFELGLSDQIKNIRNTSLSIGANVSGNFADGIKANIGSAISAAKDLSIKADPFDDKPTPDATPKKPSGYGGLLAAAPVNQGDTTNNTNTSNSYSETSTKRVIIQNLIGSVTVRDEADEDRLVDKIIRTLADEIDEADNNMGEEVFE